jgi:hypothetical protein
MGKSPDQVQKQESSPWKPLAPVLQDYIGQVQGHMKGPAEVYGGQRVGDLSPQTMGGVHSMFGAGNQNQVTAASQPMVAATARGDYLNGSPQWQGLMDRQAGKLGDSINSLFSGAGRYGSVAHQGAMADQVGNFRNQAMNDNYGRERQNQMAAAGMSGMFEGLDQADAMSKLQAGGVLDQNNQAKLDAERQKWLEGQKSTQLAQSMGLMNPLLGVGGSSTTTVPGQKPGFGQIAGLGLGILGTAMGGPMGGTVGSSLGKWAFGGGGGAV